MARRFFVRVNASVGHTTRKASGFAIAPQPPTARNGGADHAHKFASMVDRLPAAVERLRRVQLECKPALEVIGRFGAEATVALYVDPPYLDQTRSLWTKRRGRDYQHEFSTEADHRALAHALAACRSGVVLSGYPSALYDELYQGWWRVERAVNVPMGNGVGRGIRHATEVVWANRPLTEQPRLALDPAEVGV